MARLVNPGSYDVKITDAVFKEMANKDDGSFMLSLKCETPDGYEIYHDLFFTHKTYESGKNAGRKVHEVSAELLKSLGVEGGYPGNMRQAINIGLEGNIKVEWDEYADKKTGEMKKILRSKWLNPIRKSRMSNIDNVDMDAVFDSFLGKVKADEAAPIQEILDNAAVDCPF